MRFGPKPPFQALFFNMTFWGMSVCPHTDSIRKVVFDDLPSGELASKVFTSVSDKVHHTEHLS